MYYIDSFIFNYVYIYGYILVKIFVENKKNVGVFFYISDISTHDIIFVFKLDFYL